MQTVDTIKLNHITDAAYYFYVVEWKTTCDITKQAEEQAVKDYINWIYNNPQSTMSLEEYICRTGYPETAGHHLMLKTKEEFLNDAEMLRVYMQYLLPNEMLAEFEIQPEEEMERDE